MTVKPHNMAELTETLRHSVRYFAHDFGDKFVSFFDREKGYYYTIREESYAYHLIDDAENKTLVSAADVEYLALCLKL